MAEFLSRPFADRSPRVGMLERVQRQKIALRADIEAEFAVEILRHRQIRNGKMKMIDRVSAKFARPAAWLDVSLDRRHRSISCCPDVTPHRSSTSTAIFR